MRFLIILAALVLAPAVVSAEPWVFTEKAQAQPTTYAQAYKQHTQTGKPLLLAIGANWCVQCKLDKRDVLTPMKDAGLLDDAVFLELDQDKEKALVLSIKAAARVPANATKLAPCYVVFRRTGGQFKAAYHIGKISRAEVLRMIGGR